MNCDDAEILLHGLLDDEIDVGAIDSHVAACSRCALELRHYRALQEIMRGLDLRLRAPAALRREVLAELRGAAASVLDWRRLFAGFVSGSALCATAAALVMITVMRSSQDAALTGDVLSAHLRSLKVNQLVDVQTADRGALQPWFGEHLGAEPPVPDLRSHGLELIGGRIDFVLGEPVAAIAYRRNDHIVNVFVARDTGAKRPTKVESLHGFNVALWSDRNLKLCAVGDVSAKELRDIRKAFAAALSTART